MTDASHISPIANPLSSTDLDVIALTDPDRIRLYATKVADQMNKQSKPTFSDLSDRIGDIKILTAAQGASFLEVHIIDPVLSLLISGFISVADDGFLDPPIELNFPPDTTDCVWRLCACKPTFSAGMTDANLILTFEDKIASVLREVDAQSGGVKQSNPGETLGGFMKRLVDAANRKGHAGIKLVELIAPSDPNYRPPTSPTSASQANASPSRKNPQKNAGLTRQQARQVTSWTQLASELFGGSFSKIVSISDVEQQVGSGVAGLFG